MLNIVSARIAALAGFLAVFAAMAAARRQAPA